jgi:hypothetical protein
MKPILSMTSRSISAALTVLLLAPLSARGDPPQIDSLLKQLTREPPATTPFVEAHFSRMLARPLIVSGELAYLGPDALARTVREPYHEHTEIHGETVTVEREGGKARKFSLQRAPELRSLLSSFAALLGGNRAGLEQQFDLDLKGEEADWTLSLTPRDARVRERVRSIVVNGNGAEPRCLTTSEPNDNVTITLLGSAAEKQLPPMPDRAWLEEQCRGRQK